MRNDNEIPEENENSEPADQKPRDSVTAMGSVITHRGENIILLQGKTSGDMTRVVAFNESALLIWDSLMGKDFTVSDAVAVLMDNYVVEESVATADAQKWVDTLRENGLLLPE